tara:strand:+ start:928 stop:1299 length:372 start_codon:yes stop_codon:yes gene_type:complete
MYVTEAMIQSMEEMMRNASDMEKSIKAMMETEGRMHGVELDRRHNARDMWSQLMEHMQTAAPTSSMLTEVAMPMADPNMHWHDDGMAHSHDGGDMQHSHDDTAPSEMEPTGAPMPSPADHQKT